jgi:pimeloyl-ACP methyl ester carboxylesterase
MGDSEDRKIVPDVMTAVMKGTGAVVAGGVGLGGAWLAYSALFVNHNIPLPGAIDARRYSFSSSSGGLVNWYGDEAGAGRPVVLVHGVSPYASAHEVRPLFEGFREARPVYAIDLPGFGFSERTDRVYYPELYADTLIEWIESYLPGSAQPVDLIALSLSSEFAAIAASVRPELFHSLTLISPTGLADSGEAGASEQMLRLSSMPVWSQAFYDLLTTRANIRHSLRKRLGRSPDEAFVDYAYRTSHRPGARFAPLHYLSGHLNTRRIREFYGALSMPVLVLADEDHALADFVIQRQNWWIESVPCAGDLPHFENLAGTVLLIEDFWRHLPVPALIEG